MANNPVLALISTESVQRQEDYSRHAAMMPVLKSLLHARRVKNDILNKFCNIILVQNPLMLKTFAPDNLIQQTASYQFKSTQITILLALSNFR